MYLSYPQDRINARVIYRAWTESKLFGVYTLMFYLTIVNKQDVTVTLGWQDSIYAYGFVV